MRHIPGFASLLVAGALVKLAACGGQDFDPPQAGEIPRGPGLFSGERGAFVLYGGEAAGQQSPPPATTTPTSPQPDPSAAAAATSDNEAAVSPAPKPAPPKPVIVRIPTADDFFPTLPAPGAVAD